MSSPLTAAALKALRGYAPEAVTGGQATLAEITLTDPSALTLRFATRELHTPDGNTWESMIGPGGFIRAQGEFLDPGIQFCEAELPLLNRRAAAQGSGKVLAHLFKDYQWADARVRIYLWDTSLSAWSDAALVFTGRVNRPKFNFPRGEIRIFLIQDRAWNKPMPPKLIIKAEYQNCPEQTLGAPKPVVYGEWRSPKMRPPWDGTYGTDSQRYESCGGAGLQLPAVVVDRGTGPNNVTALLADNQLKSFTTLVGTSLYISQADIPSRMDGSGTVYGYGATPGVATESDHTVRFADENQYAWATVMPFDVRTTGAAPDASYNNTSRLAIDGRDETTYAILDKDSGKTRCAFMLPNLSPLGTWIQSNVYIGYKYKSGAAGPATVYLRRVDGGGAGTTQNIAVSSTITTTVTGIDSAYYDAQAWSYGSRDFGGTNVEVDLIVDGSGMAAGQQLYIYFIAIVVNYRPSLSLVANGYAYTTLNSPARDLVRREFELFRKFGGHPLFGAFAPLAAYLAKIGAFGEAASIYEITSPLSFNCQGWPDDGSGTYTGTAAALVERTGDMMRHAVATYGGASPPSCETAASTWGSFVDARTALLTVEGAPFVHSLYVGTRGLLAEPLRSLAWESLSQIIQDRFGDGSGGERLRLLPWVSPTVADYGLSLSKYHMLEFDAELSSNTDVRNSVRVKYGFEPATGKFLYDTFVNPLGSGQGVNDPGNPGDQSLEVTSFVTGSTCSTTSGSRVVTTTGTFLTGARASDPVKVGMGIFVTGIPAGTIVLSVDSDTQITMNYNATATSGATPVALTFTRNGFLAFGNSPGLWGSGGGWAPPTLFNSWNFCSIATGVYTPQTLAKAIRDKMSADYSGGYEWQCGWGFDITAENDTFYYRLTGSAGGLYTTHGFAVPRASYAGGAQLAEAVMVAWQTDLGAAGTAAVTFDDATRLFTLTLSGTSAPTTGFTLALTSSYGSTIFSALGYQRGIELTDTSAPFTIVGTQQRGLELFYITFSGLAGKLGWFYGPTNMAALIGSTDTTDTVLGGWLAGSHRGTRQMDADDSADTYGENGDQIIRAQTLRDYRCATALRDRLFDWQKQPRVRVSFSTHVCPDLQRGRVLSFSDMDDWGPFPDPTSDGLWAGKLFRVLEVTQRLGPTFEQSIVAIQV